MAVIETWFEQDLQKPVKVRYIDGNLFSHNGNGNRIGVIVTNNGDPVTLTGTVSGYAVLADGTTVPCAGTRSGNKASILVPAAAYSPGSILISIFLTDGTTVTTLAALSSSVIMARTGNQIDPGSVVTDWTNTINAAMQSVETAAANLGNIIATPYANLTFPVPLGKYTIYNNGLYRCISPIASSEEWTAAHWTNVKLGDDVAELKSLLNSTQAAQVSTYETHKGHMSNSGTWNNINNNYLHVVIPISPGSSITLSTNGATSFGILTSYTEAVNDAQIPYSSDTSFSGKKTIGSTPTTYVAPNDAAYIVVEIKDNGTTHNITTFIVNGYNLMKSVPDNWESVAEMETNQPKIIGVAALSNYPETKGNLSNSGTWNNINNNYKHVVIPVIPGDIITLATYALSNYGFLKTYSVPTDGATVDYATGASKANVGVTAQNLTVPADAHYIAIMVLSGGTDVHITTFEINGYSIINNLITDNWKKVKTINDHFYDGSVVRWCAMGDSITQGWYSYIDATSGEPAYGQNPQYTWVNKLCKINFWQVTNEGIGGTGYVFDTNGENAGWQIVSEIDFTDYDIVTVAYGVNDWKGKANLGYNPSTKEMDNNYSVTPTTICGAMRKTLETIMTSNPNCKIFVITPLNCKGYAPSQYGDESTNWGIGYSQQNSGTLEDVFQMMQTVCEYYGIDLVDMTHFSIVNRKTLPLLLLDGVHPSIDCHTQLAHELAKKIMYK